MTSCWWASSAAVLPVLVDLPVVNTTIHAVPHAHQRRAHRVVFPPAHTLPIHLGTDSTIRLPILLLLAHHSPALPPKQLLHQADTPFQPDGMVLDFSAHQPSVLQRSRQWPDHSSGSPVVTSSSSPPNSSFSQSNVSQRRRSVAVNAPPAVPPPSQPIPHLPYPSSAFPTDEEATLTTGIPDDSQFTARHRSSTSASQNPYSRPAGFTNLTAVAAFPHNRHHVSTSTPVSNSNSSQPLSSTVVYTSSQASSDPAPKSMTRPSHLNTQASTQDIVPDRLLLSPHHPHSSSESRPSSRRALTRALELAREAVQLDATNDDPHAAVIAYGRSVALLSEVMERVRRGEDTSDGRRRNGRRRSVVAQEEEVRRLKSIVCYTRHTVRKQAHQFVLSARYIC